MKWLVRSSTNLLTYTVILPYYLHYNQRITETFLFCAWLNYPFPGTLRATDKVKNCQHSFILLPNGERIGLWSINNSGDVTIIYCHGNSCNRGQKTRVAFYTKFCDMGYNIVTFDYRGFGDSRGDLSAENMIEDTYSVVKWSEEYYNDTKLVLWGHSLGSGVSVEFLATHPNTSVIGCVLEAPFMNSTSGALNHPIVLTLTGNDMLKSAIQSSLRDIFPSDQLIHRVKVPIHIIHATDDTIIPIKNSIELMDRARLHNKRDISMMMVQEGGHKNLSSITKATDSVAMFINKVLKSDEVYTTTADNSLYDSTSSSRIKARYGQGISLSEDSDSSSLTLTYKHLLAACESSSESSIDYRYQEVSLSDSEGSRQGSDERVQVQVDSVTVQTKTSSSEHEWGSDQSQCNSQAQLLGKFKQIDLTNVDI